MGVAVIFMIVFGSRPTGRKAFSQRSSSSIRRDELLLHLFDCCKASIYHRPHVLVRGDAFTVGRHLLVNN